MSNDYFNVSGNPPNRGPGTSALIRTEYVNIQTGFGKLPTFAGNANKLVVVDPTGTFLTVAFSGVYGVGAITTNAAYGLAALNANTTGSSNSAFGSNAMSANTDQANNTAFGASALRVSVTGYNNTAIGSLALTANLGGNNNTAVGLQALKANTSGASNVAVGSGSLAAMLTGSSNVAVGTSAILLNTSGTGNAAFGQAALGGNITGSFNTVAGYFAAASFTGSNIVAIGYFALNANTSGANNTAVGYSALAANTIGASSVAVGFNALAAATTVGYNVAVGDSALAAITTGSSNTAVGQNAGGNATGATATSVFIGTGAGSNVSGVSSQSVFIGCAADSGATSCINRIAIGYSASAILDNQVVIGNSSVTETVLRGQVKGGAGTGTAQPILIGAINVNTTAVGNVGVGTDDLMTYALPANSLSANNKGLRIKAWGTTANNANAKTITINFGGTIINTIALTISQVNSWYFDLVILRSGASTQAYLSEIISRGPAGVGSVAASTAAASTEIDTAAITIKCTGAATANDDIVQNVMLIEFIN